MSPSRPSTWLVRAILEQALRHATLRESPAQTGAIPSGLDAQPFPIQLEFDVRSGVQTCAFAQVLWYDDLPLGTDTMSHTDTV
jgi:hypothetical protein